VGLTASELEETLGLHVAASLPSSRDVLTAVNRGEVIVRANRGHQVSKALAVFAAELLRAHAASDAESPADAVSNEGGGRRFRRTKKVS
jgi:pilus assembly protein CpaE